MKIVIIGDKGQLGTDCRTLLSEDHEVMGCDFPHIDIGSRSSVDAFFHDIHPDIIINCAAFTAVDICETELQLSWQVNAQGPKYLAKAGRRLGCKLIHISTDYIFDGFRPAPTPYLESDPANPISQYGKSKLAGEEAVQQYAGDHIILRTAWLYSLSGPNFLKTMLKLAVTRPEQELKVVNDQYGALTWSRTLTEQIRRILDTDINGIVHATSEGHSSWYEGARYFLDAMGVPYKMRPCTSSEYPTPAARPANSILENKVLKDAGLSIFTNWQEDIDIFVADNKEQLLAEALENRKNNPLTGN